MGCRWRLMHPLKHRAHVRFYVYVIAFAYLQAHLSQSSTRRLKLRCLPLISYVRAQFFHKNPRIHCFPRVCSLALRHFQINAVGFDNNKKAITVDFNYDAVNATTGDVESTTIQVPLLALVPIPFLRVRADHDFILHYFYYCCSVCIVAAHCFYAAGQLVRCCSVQVLHVLASVVAVFRATWPQLAPAFASNDAAVYN